MSGLDGWVDGAKVGIYIYIQLYFNSTFCHFLFLVIISMLQIFLAIKKRSCLEPFKWCVHVCVCGRDRDQNKVVRSHVPSQIGSNSSHLFLIY